MVQRSARHLAVFDLPTMVLRGRHRLDWEAVAFLLEPFTSDIRLAVVEAVHSMPGEGVSSVFWFGAAWGELLGILSALGIRTLEVEPATWKTALNVRADKESSRLRATGLWPYQSSLWKLKKHHGRAEAVLLAEYGSRITTR